MKLCWARIAKNIAYFLVPIFLILVITSVAGILLVDSNIGIKNTTDYYETTLFSNNYFMDVYHTYSMVAINEITGEELYYDYYTGSDVQENVDINGKQGFIYYEPVETPNFRYLVIDEENAIARTNVEHTMKTDTIEEIKQELSQNSIYWNYEKGEINTSILNLSMENIRYDSTFESMMKKSSY